MRHRPRHTRRRASWGFANFVSMQGTCDPTKVISVPSWILPPGRVQWLMEQGRKDSLTCKGIHMWLDFSWIIYSGSFTNPAALPRVEFFVKKAEASGVDDVTPNFVLSGANVTSPWAQPTPPSAVADWDELEADDGTDSFMWSHVMNPSSAPNTIVTTYNGNAADPAGYAFGNQTNKFFRGVEGKPDYYVCRTFDVRMAWQPDVVIRSARRLAKGEGIAIAMNVYSNGSEHVAANLDVHSRTLVA